MTIAVPVFSSSCPFLPLIPVSFLLAFLLVFFGYFTCHNDKVQWSKRDEGSKCYRFSPVIGRIVVHSSPFGLPINCREILERVRWTVRRIRECGRVSMWLLLTQYLHNFSMISARPLWSVIFMACYYLPSKCSGKTTRRWQPSPPAGDNLCNFQFVLAFWKGLCSQIRFRWLRLKCGKGSQGR